MEMKDPIWYVEAKWRNIWYVFDELFLSLQEESTTQHLN